MSVYATETAVHSVMVRVGEAAWVNALEVVAVAWDARMCCPVIMLQGGAHVVPATYYAEADKGDSIADRVSRLVKDLGNAIRDLT